MDEHIWILTPENIPKYAALTGRSEEVLMQEYTQAKAQNKVLYGLYLPSPWWIDEVNTEDD